MKQLIVFCRISRLSLYSEEVCMMTKHVVGDSRGLLFRPTAAHHITPERRILARYGHIYHIQISTINGQIYPTTTHGLDPRMSAHEILPVVRPNGRSTLVFLLAFLLLSFSLAVTFLLLSFSLAVTFLCCLSLLSLSSSLDHLIQQVVLHLVPSR
jgi:hypothetical protein